MSNETDKQATLFAAISRAVAKAQAVAKGSENTFSRYKYASAEALIEESRGCLASEGLAVVPYEWRLVPLASGPVSTGGKAGMYFADVVVAYFVVHKDGGALRCEATTPAVTDNGRPQDKAVATALTYSLGYFLRTLLLLPRVDTEHDVDQRDDRGHESRGGGDRRSSSPPNSNGKTEKQDKSQPHGPAAHAPPFDVEKVITAIREAPHVDKLRLIADEINANAPKADKPRLNQEYTRRKTELLKQRAEADAAAGREQAQGAA